MAFETGSLSSKGQITIPKAIRKTLKLTHKEQLVVFQELDDGRVLIQNHVDTLENKQSVQMNLLKYLSKDFKTIFVVTTSSDITRFYEDIRPSKRFIVINDINEIQIKSKDEVLIVTTNPNNIGYIEKLLIIQDGNFVTLFENN
ncbi:type II toxin-antitoxin system PrlF family antitoxin [Rummeliibacillus pycnus]|uniref:type II toxin-antitoxin system PrlF family antitoxin n=1 Tax=Rummeliibacillus pycnus TaxID=101070 RepID=UPI003D287B7C